MDSLTEMHLFPWPGCGERVFWEVSIRGGQERLGAVTAASGNLSAGIPDVKKQALETRAS